MTDWKLVPAEPTPEMVEAARAHHEGEAYLPYSLYTAMIAAAPPAPVGISGWRPIATAPDNDVAILTWGTLHEDGIGETPRVRVSWIGGNGRWYAPCTGTHAPSHWMPLPPSPAKERDDV